VRVRTRGDPDLGLSPLFNSMPVLRHGIHPRETSVDFLMVWISVPDLQVHPSPQRYTHLGSAGPDAHRVRFESLANDGFMAEVMFDRDGLVTDYPGIARRIA
jgi:hypothetical protein